MILSQRTKKSYALATTQINKYTNNVNEKTLNYIADLAVFSKNYFENFFVLTKTKNINLSLVAKNVNFYNKIFAKFNVDNYTTGFRNLVMINDLVNTVSYTLTIKHFKTNTYFIVANIFKTLKLNYSASLLKLKKKQRIKKPAVYFNMTDHLIQNSNSIVGTPFAIHFNNIAKTDKELIIIKLKNRLNFSVLKSFFLHPHNGCRGKKLKRIKRRVSKKK